jgi:hypothetical protein
MKAPKLCELYKQPRLSPGRLEVHIHRIEDTGYPFNTLLSGLAEAIDHEPTSQEHHDKDVRTDWMILCAESYHGMK